MTDRRSFLGLVLGLAAWAGLPGGQRSAEAASWAQAAQEFAAYRKRNEWILEWFEWDDPWEALIAYSVKATSRLTGEVRAKGWVMPLLPTREQRWQQRRTAKAKMYEWAKTNLA